MPRPLVLEVLVACVVVAAWAAPYRAGPPHAAEHGRRTTHTQQHHTLATSADQHEADVLEQAVLAKVQHQPKGAGEGEGALAGAELHGKASATTQAGGSATKAAGAAPPATGETWASWAWRQANESPVGDYVGKAFYGSPPVSAMKHRPHGKARGGKNSMKKAKETRKAGPSKVKETRKAGHYKSPATAQAREQQGRGGSRGSDVDGRRRAKSMLHSQSFLEVESTAPAKKSSRAVGQAAPPQSGNSSSSSSSSSSTSTSTSTSSSSSSSSSSENNKQGQKTHPQQHHASTGKKTSKQGHGLEEVAPTSDPLVGDVNQYILKHFETNYECANDGLGRPCTDSCYRRLLNSLSAAPAVGIRQTSDWVMCQFLTAGSTEPVDCALMQGSVTGEDGYQMINPNTNIGRLQAVTSSSSSNDQIATMEEWLTMLRQYCGQTPMISHLRMTIASTQFEIVMEHRRDCTTRIYHASPHNVYGLSTWLRKPDEALSPYDLYPFSDSIPYMIKNLARRDIVRRLDKEAKRYAATLDPKFVSNFTSARRMYGSGKPLSAAEFEEYVLRIKDAYTVYCDGLHNAHRNVYQLFNSYIYCGRGHKRQKPQAERLFVDNFGESLDQCSPSECSFDFDTWTYDEDACDRDFVRDAQLKETLRTPALQRLQEQSGRPVEHVHLPVDWEMLEQSPAAEEDDFDETHATSLGNQKLHPVKIIHDFINKLMYTTSSAVHQLKVILASVEKPKNHVPINLDDEDDTSLVPAVPGAPLPRPDYNSSTQTKGGGNLSPTMVSSVKGSPDAGAQRTVVKRRKRATKASTADASILEGLFD